MLDAALRYADNGWRVFPLVANGKTPATEHGFKDASTAESRIREWFGNGRPCNLGIATGAGLLVIDVDVKGGVDGYASLVRLETELGPLGDTRTAVTPSGGRHLYYATTEDVPSSAGTLGPGLDVRGAGGYVVAPPSTINGTPYSWEDDLPVRPLLAAVQRIQQARSAGADFHELDGLPVPIGQQEDTLNRRACSLRRGGVSRAAAVAGLWADVQTWERDPAQRPWTLADVEAKVAHAWRDIEPLPEVAPTPADTPAPSEGPRLAFAVRSPDELEAEIAPEPLAGKWLPVGGFGAIFGAPGAGKSLLSADLGLSLAAGIPWLGIPVIGMVPTLYVLGEGRLWLRMEAWRRGHPDADWGLFRSHDGFKFSDPAQVAALLDYIQHERPALVAFDTLATTIGGDENSSQDMGRVIDACLEVQRLTAYQTAVMLVCHPGKDGAKGIRGHSSLEASLEVIARVTGVPSTVDAAEIGYGCATGGSVELTSRKNKEGARVEPLAATLHSGGLRPFLRPAAGPAKLSAGALTMLRALAEAGGTMAAHQWGKDSGLHRTQVWRLRIELSESGYALEDAATGIVTLTDRGEAVL
jgi:Bifunctional DNA primase/polymerase, N-terminal/AAA domain